jgi:hypothetical protein
MEGRSAVEYVVLESQHPKWLNLHLPNEVAELLQFRVAEVRDLRTPARGISFLSRGPGIVRVVGSLHATEILPLETLRNRFIAPAAVTDRGIFNLPGAVSKHLGIQSYPRPGSGLRGTDDQLIWFLPAPEYYEYRAMQRLERPWAGPSTGGFAHLYLSKAIHPMDPDLEGLEAEIEHAEWRPRLEALARARRSARRRATPEPEDIRPRPAAPP